MKLTRHWVVAPLLIFLITRTAIFLAGYAGRIAFLDEIGLGPWHMHPNLPALHWSRWDSGFYQDIARTGYWYESSQSYSAVVFFPLYPLLIRLVAVALGDLVLAGVVVSHLCLLGAPIYLLLAGAAGDGRRTDRAAGQSLYLSIFPTAFFFGVVHTESAFLLFAAGCVYLARRRRWLPAALLVWLLVIPLLVGVALYVSCCFNGGASDGPRWYAPVSSPQAKRPTRRAVGLFALLVIQLSLVGLLLYMAYLWRRFGDPLLFLDAQAAWSKQAGGSPSATGWLIWSRACRRCCAATSRPTGVCPMPPPGWPRWP